MRIWSEIRIWFGSKIGNDYVPSRGNFGGSSEVKRPGGDFIRFIFSNIGTNDGILLSARGYWKVGGLKYTLWEYLLVYYLDDNWKNKLYLF